MPEDKSPAKAVYTPKYQDSKVLPALKKRLPTATRQGRGSQVYEYIPTRFVSDRLTEIWGIDWDFEIIDKTIDKGHVAVQVRIHYPTETGVRGFKDAFGGAQLEDKIGLGDCLKKATSLGLKKAASLLGIDLQDEEASPASEDQKNAIIAAMEAKGFAADEDKLRMINAMTSQEAEAILESLQ
jgi:hypothetical protein